MSVITTDAMDHKWHHVHHYHCCYGPLLIMPVITTVAMDHKWHHVRHCHCSYGPFIRPCPSLRLLLWTKNGTMSVIVTVPMDRNWHHDRHYYCYYGPLVTPCPSLPLLLWTTNDTMSVICTVAMDHYWHHVRHHHCCYGPLLTKSVITTVPMDHKWHHVRHCHCSYVSMNHNWHHDRHHYCCYGSLVTPCPSLPLLLWTIIYTMSVFTTAVMDHYWHFVRCDSACLSPRCVTDRRTVTTAKTRSCVPQKSSGTTPARIPRPSCSSTGEASLLFTDWTVRCWRPSVLLCAPRLISSVRVSRCCCIYLSMVCLLVFIVADVHL